MILTENGHPIATLRAIPETDRQGWALVTAGPASWSGGKPEPLATAPKVNGSLASDIATEDRR